MWLNEYQGELAALLAAFLWAVSSIIYGFLGQKIPPLQLNLFKGLIAIALIVLTKFIAGGLIPQVGILPVVWLLVSGIIGIGLGDSFYFAAINSIGARKTLLLETLAPPLTGLLALIFLGEKLGLLAWGGIFLTVLGVAWVITERTITTVASNNQQGIIWAILAAIAQATGAVISRNALVESNISSLSSTLLRLIGGTIIVLILLGFQRFFGIKNQEKEATKWSIKLVAIIILTAFGSTYLGIWLQQTSLKLAPAGVAQTLLATSPLFVLPFAAISGDRISFRAILGVLLSLGGIALLFVEKS